MPLKKENHFVPRFYLRNFGVGNSIALYNIEKQLLVPNASIPSQCQRDYLYGRAPELEDGLGKLEGQVAKIIRKIIKEQKLPAKESREYISLVTFVCFQMTRTPHAGDDADDMLDRMLHAVLRDDPSLPAHIREKLSSVKMKHKNPVLFSMGTIGKFPFVLHDLNPILLVNDSEVGFVTSDCPAVKYNQWAQYAKDRGSLGLICSGLQIFLPLSPKLLLLLYDAGIYSIPKPRISTAYSVHGINALQLTSAIDNLYFDGRQETLAAIKRLPFHWRHEARNARHLVEAKLVPGARPSRMFQTFETVVGQLKIPEIRIRRDVRSVPTEERANSLRLDARMALAIVQGSWRPPRQSGKYRAVNPEEMWSMTGSPPPILR